MAFFRSISSGKIFERFLVGAREGEERKRGRDIQMERYLLYR